jgi:hypothetical protein
MKKLTVGLAILLSGYAAHSLASLPTGNPSKCSVCVPSYCGGFTFGVTGLYWRASTPENDFAVSFPSLDNDGRFLFTGGNFNHHNHRYDWGWKANIGYVFPCSGNDVVLTYTNWNNSHNHHIGNNGFLLPSTTSIFNSTSILRDPDDFGRFFAAEFGPVTYTGTASIATPAGEVEGSFPFVAPTTLLVPFDPSDIVGVHASSRFENNTWDLDFGQTINVGCNFKLRWFGGLRYSRIEHHAHSHIDFAKTQVGSTLEPVLVTATFTITTVGTPTATAPAIVTPVADVSVAVRDVVRQRSEFSGIGPRVGFDANYHIGCGFGVVGNISTSLLIGDTDAHFSERIETAGTIAITPADLAATTIEFIGPLSPSTTSLGAGATPIAGAITGIEGVAAGTTLFLDPTTPFEHFSFRHPDQRRVVPNIDAKLGVDWTYQFCNCSRSRVTIEAGYMVSHYFDVVDRLSRADAFSPENRSRHVIDTSFDGPYVGVQVNL